MAPVDFTKYTNDQHTIHTVIWGYIYTLKMEIYIKDNTWIYIIFTILIENLQNIVRRELLLLGK